MIFEDSTICPTCGKQMKHYDRVKRIVRTKNGTARWITIERWRCSKCGNVHREIPHDIFPYKHYEAEVIKGVLEGLITPDTLGFEDYPCETTMKRWRTQNLHLLL